MAAPRAIHLVHGLALLAASCGGTTSDSGIEASLQLSGAGVQYVPGPLLDDPSAVGPLVRGISTSGRISPGTVGRSVSGSTSGDAATVLLGLDGDAGHYIVPVSGPDIDNQPDLLWSATAALAQTAPVGSALLRARAVASDGTVGPGVAQALTVQATAVTGTLVIALTWDTESDLDLHVITPAMTSDGKLIELWSNSRTTLPPRSALDGGPYTDDELAMAGIYDFDSNAQCLIDGVLNENAYWTTPPPSGHYIVRVDAFNMCGQPAARWKVTITVNDQVLGTYLGTATDADTRFPHGAGAGLTVAEFDL
jgi:hypothetical protein